MTEPQQLAERISRLEEALMFTDQKCDDLSVQVLRLNTAVERAERRVAELEAASRAVAQHGELGGHGAHGQQGLREEDIDEPFGRPGKNVATDESHKPPHY